MESEVHQREFYAARLMRAHDIDPTPENMEQLNVFLKAVQIYGSRTGSYGQVWRQYGALSNLVSVARKVDRLMHSWWHAVSGIPALHKDNLDDAFDLLNYAAFFIRNATSGNITGEQPERPEY